jgi:hypothetical protein
MVLMLRVRRQRTQRNGHYRMTEREGDRESEMSDTTLQGTVAMGVGGYGVLLLCVSKEVLISKCFKL